MKSKISSLIIVLANASGTERNEYILLKFRNKICEAEVTGKIMTGKNWRFWTNSVIFFPAHNLPSHGKTRHDNFPE